MRTALQQIGTQLQSLSPQGAASQSPNRPASPKAAEAQLHKQLAGLGRDVRALTETLKAQQQRLAKLEKHFGLPNSATYSERSSPTAEQPPSWPMDLNTPMDRQSVDKAVSFHDL